MKRSLVYVAVMGLCGCGTPQLHQVKVPIPIECRVDKPERPQMPTELLASDADIAAIVKAALAEIERREGYEIKLEAALATCTKPVAAAAP